MHLSRKDYFLIIESLKSEIIKIEDRIKKGKYEDDDKLATLQKFLDDYKDLHERAKKSKEEKIKRIRRKTGLAKF